MRALLVILMLPFGISDEDCVEFVSLIPASEVAKEFGKSELWVLSNYQVNLWGKPPSSGYRGRKVGEMISGSNARLIEKRGNDYLVISPKDKSKGWISNIQVKSIVTLNPKTFKSCNKTSQKQGRWCC
ncbi:MAG: hypothetical protein IIB41_04050 [Candidatus Marinimicrobia bacterium]|nr:hypothetical protein [Candidatus Neomarinimicrobiota bacterium]